MNAQLSSASWKSTIKGILIFPALTFIATPIKFIYIIYSFFIHRSWLMGINIVIILADIFFLCLTIYMAYFYFNRKKVIPALYIVYRMLFFVFVTFIFIATSDLFISQASHNKIVFEYFAGILGCLIFIPIFVYSKKVKKVFTEESSETNNIEKSILKIEPVLDKFYSFLLKRKKFLIPLILLFIVLTTILTIVIVALF